MNRFITYIIFAGLFATQLAPAAVFARTQPVAAQIPFVVVLRALLEAAGASPVFTTGARRVKAPDEAEIARAARALANDVAQMLRSPNVIETLRAEKDGVLGAARTVASPSFIAEELTRQFAPKPVSAKRASALDGVVAVANAGDIPTDADIQEAEAAVNDAYVAVRRARINLREAEKTENKEDIAQKKADLARAREALDKAKAKVGELKLKRGIVESVSNCTFNADTRYGTVQFYAVQPMVNTLLLRVGELIGNPYLPEDGQFRTPISRGRNGDLSPGERAATDNLRVGIGEGYEAQILFRLVQMLEAAGRGGDVETDERPIYNAFDEALEAKSSLDVIWKILGPHARTEFEKKNILGDGGLVDAIDEFLKIQRQLLLDDITPLKQLIDGAKDDIKKEMQKLEAVLRATEAALNRDVKPGDPKVKLGDIGADSREIELQIKALLEAHLNCGSGDRLDNMLYFLRAQIYSKIRDAIKNATLDMVRGGLYPRGGVYPGTDVMANLYPRRNFNLVFQDAVERNDDSAVTALQETADAAVGAAYPGFFESYREGMSEGANRRLTIRLSILLLRNLRGYGNDLDMLLMSRFRQTRLDFGNEWGLISDSPNLGELQKLLFAIDEFVRRFKEIIAGIEGLPETSLKAKFCEVKTRINEKERQKEEAMRNIERKVVEVQFGGDCINSARFFCARGDDDNYYLFQYVSVGSGQDVTAQVYNNLVDEPNPEGSTWPYCVAQYFCTDGTGPQGGTLRNGSQLTCLEGTGCKNPGIYVPVQ